MDREDYNYRTLIFIILLITPIGQLAIDIYTPSLPAVTRYFSTSKTLVQFTISIYLISYAFGQVIYGTLSDVFGRKRIILIGMSIFLLGAVLSSFSGSINFLLFSRFIQGIGLAAAGVIARSILTDCFVGAKLIKVAAYMAAVSLIAPVVAPAMGGVLQEFFGWQSCFIFLIAYCVMVMISVVFLLPETNFQRSQFKVRVLINNYLTILAHRNFLQALVGVACSYSLVLSFNVFAPFFVQKTLNFSPSQYGFLALSMGMATLLGSLSNKALVSRVKPGVLVSYGFLVIFIVSIGMLVAAIEFEASIWLLTVPTILILYFSGIILPLCAAKCLSLFPEKAGSASAAMGILFISGSALVTCLLSLMPADHVQTLAGFFVGLAFIGLLIGKYRDEPRMAEE